jgi:hypothetical protein
MNWPAIPSDDPSTKVEFNKILYQGQVDEAAAQLRDHASAQGRDIAEDWELERYNWELEKAARQAEYALQKSIHDARVDISRGSLERAYKGAEFLRNAAAAIATVYTGIAGLSFATKDGLRLPARGIVPGLFLGLALVFSTAYVAWLGRPPAVPAPVPHSSPAEYQERRLNTFADWVSGIVLDRSYALHSAVICLGAGAVFLVLPFVSTPTWFTWGAPILAAVATLVFPATAAVRALTNEPNRTS